MISVKSVSGGGCGGSNGIKLAYWRLSYSFVLCMWMFFPWNFGRRWLIPDGASCGSVWFNWVSTHTYCVGLCCINKKLIGFPIKCYIVKLVKWSENSRLLVNHHTRNWRECEKWRKLFLFLCLQLYRNGLTSLLLLIFLRFFVFASQGIS